MGNNLKKILMVFIVAGLVFSSPYSVLGQKKIKPGLTLTPVTKLRVTGSVSVQKRPATTYFHPFFAVYTGSNPARGLEIKADGHNVPEYEPGRYRNTVKGYAAMPGKMIKVTIKLPERRPIRPVGPEPKMKPITATATIGAMASFITPLNNGILTPAGRPPSVTFSWTRGKAPYKIFIYEYISPTKLGAQVFTKSNIMSTSIPVPAKIFVPGKQYRIYLIYEMGKFSIKGDYAPGSEIKLRFSNAVTFSIR